MWRCPTSVAVVLLATLFVGSGPKNVSGSERDQLNVIVPLGAGGALDRFARTAEQFLPDIASVDVIVENFSPKAGKDGYQEFLNRPADGSNVLAWFEPAAAGYQPRISLHDLAIINVQEIEPPLLAARQEIGWRSLQDMITSVRDAPNTYSFGTGGRTGGGNLLTSALLTKLELSMNTKRYASGGKARKALGRGEVDLIAGSMNAMRKLGDKVTPLAVFSPRRQRSWPEVPTIREALGPDADQAVSGAVYRFFAVRRGFAEAEPEAFQALVESFRRMTQNDERFRQHVESQGVGAHWFGPTESTSLGQRSHQHFTKLIDALPTH